MKKEFSLMSAPLALSFSLVSALLHVDLLHQDSLDEGLSYHEDSDFEHPSNALASVSVFALGVGDTVYSLDDNIQPFLRTIFKITISNIL